MTERIRPTDTQQQAATEWRYSGRLLAALQVAAQLHATQVRKGTQIPYLSHLLGACTIALEHGATEDEAIAALLHDAIEDVRPVEAARSAVAAFGPEVLRIVEACTDADTDPKPPWRERKERYVAHLHDADGSVLLVSASDKLHNAGAIVRDVRRHGAAVWDRFNAGKEGTLWYYCALVTAFRSNPAHDPDLIDELDRVVQEMEVLGRAGTNAGAASAPDDGIQDLIERHADTALRPVAEEFVRRLRVIPGVELRLQKSKHDPSYFQVRHADRRQVMAYVQPRPTHMSVLFRLPADHDTRGLPTSRYDGPRVRVSQVSELPVALELVRESVAHNGQ